MKKILVILAFFLVGAGIASAATAPGTAPGTAKTEKAPLQIDYSVLLDKIDKKQVEKLTILPDEGIAKVTFKDAPGSIASIPRNSESVQSLVQSAKTSGASISIENAEPIKEPSALRGFLGTFLIIGLIMFGFFFFASRQRKAQQKLGALRDSQVNTPGNVFFRDIAGCDEAVEEVSEFIEFLTKPEKFLKLGAKMPKGILLHGPPGTGKTTLAKALANEAGVDFYAVSGSDFVEKYVGVGASRVRELFEQARKAEKGAIIFIDELDAIGKKRAGGDGMGGGGNDEREQTLNQILAEMDGFSSTDKVVCVAATNRIDVLDEALTRPGRFSRHVHVGLPSEEGRLAILKLYARGKPLDKKVDLEKLASVTASSSGADLADIINEAAIMAAREDKTFIEQSDLEEGHLRSLAGPEKRHSSMQEDEIEIVAYHEAGHVLTAELCTTHEIAQRATIKPRGMAAGLALYGKNDRTIHSTQYIHEQLICVLGGRAAEQVTFGTVSSGAANDLQRANAIARNAVEELGLSQKAGQIINSRNTSEASKTIVDQEVERMLAEAYGDAIRMLETHGAQLKSLADGLQRVGDIDRLEILRLIGDQESLVKESKRIAMGPMSAPILTKELATPTEPAFAPLPRKARIRKAVTQFRKELKGPTPKNQ